MAMMPVSGRSRCHRGLPHWGTWWMADGQLAFNQRPPPARQLMCSVQFYINRPSSTECQVRGRFRAVLVSVPWWYLKRGFLGFCFFNEDETHLANLFSSIRSHLGGPRVQLSAAGTLPPNGLTTKPLPYIFMTDVTCPTHMSVPSILTAVQD